MDIVSHNARAFPSPHGQMVLLSVLVKRYDGYRAYQGIVIDNSIDDPDYILVRDWVAYNGNKMSYEDASKNFYGLSEDKYSH